MKKWTDADQVFLIPADEWMRRLGRETEAFEVVKTVEAHPDQPPMAWDSIITISVRPDQRRVDVFVEIQRQLTPKKVLDLSQRLRWLPPDGLLLVCAPYLSPRVEAMCREQNVGYLDGAGNCRIVAPGLFLHVSGHPNRRVSTRAAVDPFARKSSRIVRMLLTHPDKGWQVQQLAQEAGVSLGLASKVKETLLEEAYLEARGRLLYLRDPGKLLQDWAARYRPPVRRVRLFTPGRPAEIEKRLAEWCRTNGIAYALTQLAGAWKYAPMVRYERSVVYLDGRYASNATTALLGHLDAREVDTGANCTLWLTDDPAVFSGAREVDDVTIVAPLQLYLDLKALAGRGEEAAQEILERELPTLLPSARQEGGPPPREEP